MLKELLHSVTFSNFTQETGNKFESDNQQNFICSKCMSCWATFSVSDNISSKIYSHKNTAVFIVDNIYKQASHLRNKELRQKLFFKVIFRQDNLWCTTLMCWLQILMQTHCRWQDSVRSECIYLWICVGVHFLVT